MQPPPTPRRITFLIDTLAPGGAQTQLLRLASLLDRTRWVPTVAWYEDGPLALAVPPDVKVRSLGRRSQTDPLFLARLFDLLSTRGADLVHAWLPAPSAMAALMRRIPGRAPLVTAIRCSAHLLDARPRTGRLHRLAGLLGDRVTTNCRDVVPWLTASDIAAGRIQFIPNLVDAAAADHATASASEQAESLRRVGLDPSQRPILQVGRLDRFKAPEVLVRAWLLLRQRRPDVPPLLLVGEASEPHLVASLRRLAHGAGAGSEFVVAAPRPDVRTLMDAACVNVLASRSEGTPNVVMEAMAQGRLIIATRVGEVPRLVEEGVTGLLVPPDDETALADALGRVLDLDAAAAAAMGERARAAVRSTCAPGAIVDAYMSLYDDAVARPSRAEPGMFWRAARSLARRSH